MVVYRIAGMQHFWRPRYTHTHELRFIVFMARILGGSYMTRF